MTQAFFNQDALSFWEAIMSTGLQGVCSGPVADGPYHHHGVGAASEPPGPDGGASAHWKLQHGDWPSNHSSAFASLAPLPPLKRSLSDVLFADRGRSSSSRLSVPPLPVLSADATAAAVGGEQYVIEEGSVSAGSSPTTAAATTVLDNDAKNGTQAPSFTPSCFDKVEVPAFLHGATFQRLFHTFFDATGAISIGIFRRPNGEDERAEGADLPFVITAPEADLEVLPSDEVFVLRPTPLAR